jgi:hypothetical protein
LDGNHRVAVCIQAGFETVSQLEIRVNGYNTFGYQFKQWVPMHVVVTTTIPYKKIQSPLARGPTAEIAGDIASGDDQFLSQNRGAPMRVVLKSNQ